MAKQPQAQTVMAEHFPVLGVLFRHELFFYSYPTHYRGKTYRQRQRNADRKLEIIRDRIPTEEGKDAAHYGSVLKANTSM